MRLFVAIPLPTDVAVEASTALPEIPALRRVRPEHLHITLAFLGAVADERLDDVIAATRTAAAAHQPFTVTLEGVGRFPESGEPRVVWMGIVQGARESSNLAAALRRALTERALPFDDKPFRAHITLARVAQDADRASARAIAATTDRLRAPKLHFEVDALIPFESVLSPKGPRYTPRAAVPLGRS
ncbi:MAG: RNA 2',3'-cyclic phosphodiesterase [Chloroflexota bacterium]|nr:RNA 2',3'-cyclic phosphodiesterase [Chloroflexota bacterium]